MISWFSLYNATPAHRIIWSNLYFGKKPFFKYESCKIDFWPQITTCQTTVQCTNFRVLGRYFISHCILQWVELTRVMQRMFIYLFIYCEMFKMARCKNGNRVTKIANVLWLSSHREYKVDERFSYKKKGKKMKSFIGKLPTFVT